MPPTNEQRELLWPKIATRRPRRRCADGVADGAADGAADTDMDGVEVGVGDGDPSCRGPSAIVSRPDFGDETVKAGSRPSWPEQITGLYCYNFP